MILLVLSPHRDDAAFSCGICMRLAVEAGVSVHIMNVFTRSDYAPFAAVSGVTEVTKLRLAEDRAMCSKLGPSMTLRDLEWEDVPVRRRTASQQTLAEPLFPLNFAGEITALEEELRPQLAGADCILVPLANQHIDHKVARAAVERCAAPDRLAYYEDMPYLARLAPDARRATFHDVVPSSTQAMLLVHSDGSAVKEELASCYASQVSRGTVQEMAEYARRRAPDTGFAETGSGKTTGAEVVYAGPAAKTALEFLGAKVITL